MTELGPVEKPLTNEEILAKWGDKDGPLEELTKACKDTSHEFERLIQIRKAWYNWLMVRGNQFLAPGFTSNWNGDEIVDYINVDSSQGPDENGSQVSFAYPINVVGGDCYKFVAVMGQSAPRVKAVADDQQSSDELQVASQADAVLRDAWMKLKLDSLWRTMAFHQYTTGPTFVHTPWVTDKIKYGQSFEPKIEIQDSPDGPVPVETGKIPYDNGDVEVFIRTVLDVSVAYGPRDLRECGWLIDEQMVNKFKLLSDWPEKLSKYRTSDPPDSDTGASLNSAAQAKDSVGNPSGIGRPRKDNEWRRRFIFTRPWMFEAITDSACRETLKKQFPNGLYLAKVGDVNVALDDRSMDDEWAICKTGRGEKIIEDPICNDSIPIQRALNDLFNLAIETVLRSIPKTIVDQMLLDRKSIQSNEALPAEIIFTTTAVGTDINKMIAQIPPAHVSDQLAPLAQTLRAQMQDITGIRPELSGGGQPTQTFREAKQRKDQALAQLGPQADEMQAAAAKIAENIVRQRAKHGVGTIKSPRKTAHGNVTDVVDLAEIQESGWHVEADDNFPMSVADISDKLWGLLKEYPPEIQQGLGILDAMNLGRVLELLQLPGFESPVEEQKEKTLDDIQTLLQGSAVESQPNPDGSPSPKQPSLPVDSFDDHQFVADFTRKWMTSKEGRKAKAGNPGGFENLSAWWDAQVQAATPPPPPTPPTVRTNLNIQAKMEDMGGEFVQETMKGAGLGELQGPIPQAPPPLPSQQKVPSPGAAGEGGGDLSVPSSPDSGQESPVPETPPMPGGPPQGPPPGMIQ